MIQVQDLIPSVYNQSRDFGVFTGLMQILLNELDIKSKKLIKLPDENFLPYTLSSYPKARDNFRSLLKNRGTISSILMALYICGGGIFSFEEEKSYLIKTLGINTDLEYFERDINEWPTMGYSNNLKNHLVYYLSRKNTYTTLYINLQEKSLGDFNQDLFNLLKYYIKPVNLFIKLVII